MTAIGAQIGPGALFIGIGYGIVGDRLVDESGTIYFLDRIRERLHRVSNDIHQFLEQDIHKLVDADGTDRFAR